MVTVAYAAPSPAAPRPWLSLVIPLYNEAESLGELHHLINESLHGGDYEIIFVDDGSTDDSLAALRKIQGGDLSVRIVRFNRNFGKAEALSAGFRESRGEVVVTLDADLQDDPREIPKLVNALGRGYDLVTGWKRERRDPATKTVPSRVFNRVTGIVTGLPLHDQNSGFKAYRRRLVDDLQVYGELHRFLPVLAYWKGFRVTEVPVVHHPRRYGRSKYGARRFLSGFIDLMTVLYLTRFQRKPLHLFGPIGLACLAAGLLVNLYLTMLWVSREPIGTRPLLQLGVLLMVMGVQFLSLGLLGEMVTLNSVQGDHRAHMYEVIDPWTAAAPAPTGGPAAAVREL